MEPLTIKSEVMGDFQEPYGVMRLSGMKSFPPISLRVFQTWAAKVSATAKLCESFRYTVVKGLQARCNHQRSERA